MHFKEILRDTCVQYLNSPLCIYYVIYNMYLYLIHFVISSNSVSTEHVILLLLVLLE